MIILKNISVSELININPNNLIDIRSSSKYNDNHIMNAYNIPFDKLIMSPENYLDKNETYYIYCQRGLKSKRLCIILNSKGYNVVNIIGGYEAWVLNN